MNKPLQHWTNIRGFAPDLNIGDPESGFAAESPVDTEEDDVEDVVEDDGKDGGEENVEDESNPKGIDEESSCMLP